MALSKESIRKLRAVKAAILAEPELYDQSNSPFCTNSCETPCCIAGWALWCNNPDPAFYRKTVTRKLGVSILQDEIGLTHGQTLDLFEQWPSSGESPAWQNPCTKEAAEDCAKHIELFIKGGGAWPEAA